MGKMTEKLSASIRSPLNVKCLEMQPISFPEDVIEKERLALKLSLKTSSTFIIPSDGANLAWIQPQIFSHPAHPLW